MGYNTQFVAGSPLNASFSSAPFQIIDALHFAVQASFTGSPCSFSAYLQVSSDPYSNLPSYVPAHFDEVASSSIAFTSAGTFTWDIGPTAAVWGRLVIVDTSGGSNTGILNASVNVKGPL